MSILFIDSTYDITLGILDDGLKWIDFDRFSEKKASSVLQKEAHLMLKKNKVDPKSLKAVVTVAGPGFYTGLRLSEGFADVFKFFDIPHYSFLSYEVPFWSGISNGVWFTKAYRGEYFFHHWSSDEVRSELISSKNLPEYLTRLDEVYVHSDVALDEQSRALIKKSHSTFDLLKNSPAQIFEYVLTNKIKRDSFYFRAPEDEFRMNP